MAEEIIDGNLTINIKEKLPRDVEHEYVNHNGWCRDCGRSEGWKAHPTKEVEKIVKKIPFINPETAAPAATALPDKKPMPKGEPTSKPTA